MDSMASHFNIKRILQSNDMNELLENLKQEQAMVIALLVTVLCGVISFLLLLLCTYYYDSNGMLDYCRWFLGRKSSRGSKDSVLIMGPSSSGKTCLFSKVRVDSVWFEWWNCLFSWHAKGGKELWHLLFQMLDMLRSSSYQLLLFAYQKLKS